MRDLRAGALRSLSAAPRSSRARSAEGLRRGSMAGDVSELMARKRKLMAGGEAS